MSTNIDRKNTTILFADVVGYSRLTARDEIATHTNLKTLQYNIIQPLLRAYGGRIVRLIGDGALADFWCNEAAVECAIAVQRSIEERNQDAEEDKRLLLRIGIHTGSVIVDKSEIFGDNVNIAARLQEVAEPGGICISAQVHKDAHSKVDEFFEFSGTPSLKNIDSPVEVYIWPPTGRRGQFSALPLPDKPSIAVLPFVNFSRDEQDDWLIDGFVEDLTTALAQINWIFVVARTSAFVWKEQSIDVRDAGRKLGVGYIVEGSIRRRGKAARIAAQLINVASGTHIWADQYDIKRSDAFEIEDRITESIIGSIEPTVLSSEIARAKCVRHENLTAHQCYLRAAGLMTSAFANVRNNRFDEARDLLAMAIEHDPIHAPALALAAHFETMAGLFGREKGTGDNDPMNLAQRAIQADPSDPIVLAHYGFVLATFGPEPDDVDRAVVAIDSAIARHSNSPFIWSFSGEIRMYYGDHKTAVDHLHKSMRLNPLDNRTIWNTTFLAFAHFFLRESSEALKWAERAALTNCNPVTYRVLAITRADVGDKQGSQAAIDALLELDPRSSVGRSKGASYKRPQDLELYVDGLRKAGLPD